VIRKDHYAGFQIQIDLKQRARFGRAASPFSVLILGNGGHNMLTIRLRGETWHVDYHRGHVHEIRRTLGTRSKEAAASLAARLEVAMAQGAASTMWPELSVVLPRSTYLQFAKHIGVKQMATATWSELRERFEEDLDRRTAIHALAQSSLVNFQRVIRDFGLFLSTRAEPITILRDIDATVVRDFKYCRVESIQKKRGPNGGSGVQTELGHLHRVFGFAVEEQMIANNPVEYESDPYQADRGAQPFEPEELLRMRENLDEDRLTFIVLRWTGLRISDAASLIWQEVNLDKREIQKLTQKSRLKKRAVIPMQAELASALEAEHRRRNPKPSAHVLLDSRRKPIGRTSIYYVVQKIGERAGVAGVHPHRFRDTFAVDALLHDIPETSVARMLADTVKTVTDYYLPFVNTLREQTRVRLDTGKKLEDLAGAHWRHNGNENAS
jgi:integrase